MKTLEHCSHAYHVSDEKEQKINVKNNDQKMEISPRQLTIFMTFEHVLIYFEIRVEYCTTEITTDAVGVVVGFLNMTIKLGPRCKQQVAGFAV